MADEELKAFGAENLWFEEEVVAIFSSMCTSEVCTKRFPLLDHLVEHIITPEDISVFGALVCEKFNVQVKNKCIGSPGRPATSMQETVTLMLRLQRSERPTISIRVGSTS